MQMPYPSLEKTRVATIAGTNIYALDRDHYGKRAGSLFIMRRAADGSLTNVYFKHWPAELKAAFHYHRGLQGGFRGGQSVQGGVRQCGMRGGNVKPHPCAYKSMCPNSPDGTHDWVMWYPGSFTCARGCGCYFDDR
jgi:hypothetical protein